MAPTPRLAPSLIRFRNQVNARWPQRDKASDGWIGDAAHQARVSDHNPDQYGIVRAFDTDEDLDGHPADGYGDAFAIAHALNQSRDTRIKYVIYEGLMFSSYVSSTGVPAWTWRPYTGPNPHNKHIHMSILPSMSAANDVTPWQITAAGPGPQPTPQPAPVPTEGTCIVNLRVLKAGMSGGDVTSLQSLLNTKAGQGLRLDGEFGPATKTAVENVQRYFGIDVDGVVGAKTWPCLFL